ncbi:hypothetical protein FN846DRAFT_902370 [Sphaerosporella brunnea]|uniref:Uncharacterized protein n=1 Tax=Sphaerosporella brunnea TaxID=1250544 RepID=A0A5J5FA55_9PEZI|nr:hypothetical protein FN846DRAFT_902370 [Sphaerosporella brunnea]
MGPTTHRRVRVIHQCPTKVTLRSGQSAALHRFAARGIPAWHHPIAIPSAVASRELHFRSRLQLTGHHQLACLRGTRIHSISLRISFFILTWVSTFKNATGDRRPSDDSRQLYYLTNEAWLSNSAGHSIQDEPLVDRLIEVNELANNALFKTILVIGYARSGLFAIENRGGHWVF